MSLTLSSFDRCSSHFTSMVAFCRTCFSRSTTPLPWEAQPWSRHSRCGLSSAERRGRITSPHRPAMLVLMQPRGLLAFAMRVHRWLLLSCLSSGTQRSFSAELLSGRPATSRIAPGGLDHGLASPRGLLSTSSSILPILEMSFSSGTGHRVLQSHLGEQSPLLPGLHSPGLFPSGLGHCSLCSRGGNLLHPSAAPCHPLQHPLLGSKPLPHKGSRPWVPVSV